MLTLRTRAQLGAVAHASPAVASEEAAVTSAVGLRRRAFVASLAVPVARALGLARACFRHCRRRRQNAAGVEAAAVESWSALDVVGAARMLRAVHPEGGSHEARDEAEAQRHRVLSLTWFYF